MKIEEAILSVKSQLSEQRFKHTLRVAKEAVRLAKLHHIDPQKVELAAIFHDYAKFKPLDEMKRWIYESPLPKDLLKYHHELWHGPVGALLVEREHNISDPEIISAIRYHTTGKAHMSLFELIIFVADYIEPGRNFPGIEEVRKAAQTDIVYAAWLISRNTIQFLMTSQQKIYPDTFHAYNDLIQRFTDRSLIT